MKKHYGLLLISALTLVGCGQEPSKPKATPQESAPSAAAPSQPAAESSAQPEAASTAAKSTGTGSPITAPVDYLGAIGKAQQSAIKRIDTAALNSAVQLFHAQEGRYPKDLNELVSMQYIAQLPQAPHGMKLQYDAAQGKVSVVKQ